MKYGVVIGRMNPVHLGHIQLIKQAMADNGHVIVILGSCNQVITPVNPFTQTERAALIRSYFTDDMNALINIRFASDFIYSDLDWLQNVYSLVEEASRPKIRTFAHVTCEYTLYGCKKDESTAKYLTQLQNWKWKTVFSEPYAIGEGKSRLVLSSTYIRDVLFLNGLFGLSNPVLQECYNEDQLEVFSKWINSPAFHALQQDYDYYKSYKKSWETAPFAPVFVTGDAVVICNGYVLIIQRKGPPGKDTYALPGGFLNQNETVKQCILRELEEETKIDVPPKKLENCLRRIEVFDAPNRSLRGRTITHAGLIVLEEKTLPKIKAADDAATARWISLADISKFQSRFFEDHFHILTTLQSI